MDSFLEKALATLIVGAVVVVLVVVFGMLFNPDYCSNSTYPCRDHQVQLCVAAEKYTKEQCITLVGGGNN